MKNEVLKVISERRTVKPEEMNGVAIAQEVFQQVIEAANWAPTHGLTEPWRLIIYSGQSLKQFSFWHAELYKRLTPQSQFLEKKYTTILERTRNVSHVVVVYMKRGQNKNIPELEEICATSCAVQNMLLAAQSLGLSSYWGTGGMSYHSAFKKELDIDEEDIVIGQIFFGYSDVLPEAKRNSGIETKVKFIDK
ncbi:MAG: nitroreductase [Chitinophagales bacterium]|nr:nitroreductase [Chitinophagales bacterium]